MKNETTFEVSLYGETWKLRVDTLQYQTNGNTYVGLQNSAEDAGVQYWESFAVLSVNTDVALPAGHFYLKDYSENEKIVTFPEIQALYSACAEHGTVDSGYVTLSCHILKA